MEGWTLSSSRDSPSVVNSGESEISRAIHNVISKTAVSFFVLSNTVQVVLKYAHDLWTHFSGLNLTSYIFSFSITIGLGEGI